MEKVLIHIGYPKAASTWFKENFFSQVENSQFIHGDTINDHIIKPHAFKFDSNTEKKFFKQNYNSKIIISESILSGSLIMTGNNGIYTKEIGNRLKRTFPEAQIIIMIRNQPDIIASSYLEYIKKGGSYSINKYLYRDINIPLKFCLEFFEYDQLIGFYHELFGVENVHVFLFEEFNMNPLIFLQNVKDKFDLDIKLKYIDLRIKNSAYQKNLTKIVRFFNRFSRKGVFLKNYFIDLPYSRTFFNLIYHKLNQTSIFGGRPKAIEILGKNNLSIINQHYINSNQRLAELLNLNNLKELGYPF